jgi:hypothetical protein
VSALGWGINVRGIDRWRLRFGSREINVDALATDLVIDRRLAHERTP